MSCLSESCWNLPGVGAVHHSTETKGSTQGFNDHLIIHLQRVFFPPSNSALSKLNLLPSQEGLLAASQPWCHWFRALAGLLSLLVHEERAPGENVVSSEVPATSISPLDKCSNLQSASFLWPHSPTALLSEAQLPTASASLGTTLTPRNLRCPFCADFLQPPGCPGLPCPGLPSSRHPASR